jgi:ribonuclease R
MSKKNKNKFSSKVLSPEVLEIKIQKMFQHDIKGRYNAKDIKKKLELDNNSDSVDYILELLFQKGILVKVADGQKFKFNRNVEQKSEAFYESFTRDKNIKEKKKDNNDRKGYASGTVDATRSGAAYIISENSGLDKDIFVPQYKMLNALKGDLVKVRWHISNRGKPEGEIVEVLQRHRESFIGTMVLSKQFCFVTPDDESIPMDIIVPRNKTMSAENGDKVVVKITEWHSGRGYENPHGEIKSVLGIAGSSDIEMKSILIKNGFELDFNEAVMAENDAIPTVILPSEISNRTDLREITTFTIDPETAKDFDDALSIRFLENGNLEIGIHIADVTHYVRENSALDKEAAKRTTSVYLVDRVLPMLPEKISNGVCSLRPHEDKLTFSAIFEMDKEAKIISEWYGKTLIHSNRRFTYEEAQEILEGSEGDFKHELITLNKIAHLLRKERFRKGAINFESPEVRFVLDENGKPLESYVKERKDAHMLVEDFMLLANRMVAFQIMEHFRKGAAKIPFVYRVHDFPDMEKVQNFANFANRLGYQVNVKNVESVYSAFNKLIKDSNGKNEQAVLQQLAIRTMAKAAYSTDNIGHYGLAFQDYTHFTSPIRRYADVLVHRIFEQFLNGEKNKYNPIKLEELCKHISKKERNAMDAERESVKYKQAEFLQDHIGEVFEAFITGMTEFGVYAEIKQNHCEGLIRYENMYENFVLLEDGFHIRSLDKVYKMGDVVYIRIKRVDLTKRQIDFQMIEESAALLELSEKNSNQTVLDEVVLPKVTNESNNPISKIYDQLAIAFEKSDIKKYALKNSKEWYYSLSETDFCSDSIAILHFNPTADDKNYLAQLCLPENKIDQEKWNSIVSIINEQNGNGEAGRMVEFYFCPFRSSDESLLTELDLELSLPIFGEVLKEIKPKVILSFSPTLQQLFTANKAITNLEVFNIKQGAKNYLVEKGTIKIGKKKVTIAFLPDLGLNKINKNSLTQIWTWLNL